jgi:hypothetical protein
MADEPTAVDEDLLRTVEWLEIVNHPNHERTYGEAVTVELVRANDKVLDENIDEKQRLIYIGMVKAFSIVRNWPEEYRRAHEALKEEQALREQVQEAEDVGPELKDQWYEKRG